MRVLLLVATFLTLVSARAAETSIVESVKAYSENEAVVTELTIKGDWSASQLESIFLGEAVQFDLPQASFPKNKVTIKLTDPRVQNVTVFQHEDETTRVRLNLKKGLAAAKFADNLQITKRGGTLAIRLDAVAGEGMSNARVDGARAYLIGNDSDQEPEDEMMLERTRLVASADKKVAVGMIASTDAISEEPLPSTLDTTAAASPADSEGLVPAADARALKESEIPVVVGDTKGKKSAIGTVQKATISLGILGIVAIGTWFGLRRWTRSSKGKRQHNAIKILTQHYIGPKKSLMIVQVAGESILVGVTDHNISMLKTLSLLDEEVPQDVPRDFNSTMAGLEDDEDEFRESSISGLSQIRDRVNNRLKGMRTLS